MHDDGAAEEQDEHADAERRIQELTHLVHTTFKKVKSAEASDDMLQRLEAWDAFDSARNALLRTFVEAGHLRRDDDYWLTPAKATQYLFELRTQFLPLVAPYLDYSVTAAFAESDDPNEMQIREQARSFLVRMGWATAHELETFPEPSLRAIIAERYREWLETL